jgi:uncharacterized protein (DUF2252 family)
MSSEPTEPRKASTPRLHAHSTRTESIEQGKATRSAVGRSTLGEWTPPAGRKSPVDMLAEQATTREPDLVPIRYGRMLVSPFTFYRGAAAIMAADLGEMPSTGLRVQLCGDAHLLNFGGFASAERDLVFDVNDFDETLPGPWEWDVKRLAASLEIAAREREFTKSQSRAAVAAGAAQYREAMNGFAQQSALDVWYALMDVTNSLKRIRKEVGRSSTPRVEESITKAHTRNSLRAFEKLTKVVDGEPRIVTDPPLIVPLRDLVDIDARPSYEEELAGLLRSYRDTLRPDRRQLLDRYDMADIARKVVGVGSVGTRCWLLLLLGKEDGDPLFLQVKEAQPSVLAPFAGASTVENEGQRVVLGQRLMQASSDIFLGWISGVGLDGQQRDFYIRQLWDWKLSPDPANATPVSLAVYARMCAWTLARAHARSGDRIAIAAYLGNGSAFDRAMTEFAETYADQNERDYATFADAVKAGQLPVTTGI